MEKIVKDDQLQYLIEMMKTKYIENISIDNDKIIITKNGKTIEYDILENSSNIEDILIESKKYTDDSITKLINGAPETRNTLFELNEAISENTDLVDILNDAIGKKANKDDLTAHTANTNNPHNVTKTDIGLNNVENKSSETIRSELTKNNVVKALGYTPPTKDTTYELATETDSGLMSASDKADIKNIKDNYIQNIGIDGRNISITKNNETFNLQTQDTTYELATETDDGLMSSIDKSDIKNIKENYIQNIDIEGNKLIITRNNENVNLYTQDTTYNLATESADGLFSSTEKNKLKNIESGANKTIIDSAINASSTNPVQNKVINAELNNLHTLIGTDKVSVQIQDAIDLLRSENVNIYVQNNEPSNLEEGTIWLDMDEGSESGNSTVTIPTLADLLKSEDIILVEGKHYGNSLPPNPNTIGKLFFLKAN